MSNTEGQILGGKPEAKDFEGIALLRQIFPELSIIELHKLHTDRLRKSSENRQKMALAGHSQPTSLLGQKIWKSWLLTRSSNDLCGEELSSIGWQPVELPHGFLELPSSVAVRRFNEKNGKWYYLLVKNLESQVIEHHMAHQDFSGLPELLSGSSNIYSSVIYRDGNVGIGMTLCEKAGRVWVHSVTGKDGTRWFEPPPQIEEGGPAMKAGILPGHWLLGINGQALMSVSSAHTLLLSDAVSAIQYSSDPVVLHFHKGYVGVQDSSEDHVSPNIFFSERPSLLDLTLESNEVNQVEAKTSVKHHRSRTPRIHPFILELQRKGLVKNVSDQIRCTTQLASFTERARQWESFSSFRLNVRTYNLCFQLDANDLPTKKDVQPATLCTFDEKDFKAYAPSTPTLDLVSDWFSNKYTNHSDEVSILSDDENSRFDQQDKSMDSLSPLLFGPNFSRQHLSQQRYITESSENDIFMPLMGVRKALCVRIVNSFIDQTKTAFTIWVFDVESGREWYAPIRYQQDFQDLRADVLPLCPSLAQIPYPQLAWKVFGREKAEAEEVRRTKSRQLEHFLRRLCCILYTNPLNPVISEISMHLQSFLGCDGFDTHNRPKGLLSLNEATIHQVPEASQNKLQSRARLLLKRAFQRYVYRILLLDEMQTLVNDFVNSTRDREPQLRDIEIMESLGRTKLKERSMEELEKIQYFLDQIQSLILEGCRSDFYSICRRSHYNILQPLMEGAEGDLFIDRVVREAVREQIEIEIYVPLRGVVSRLLVNGWRLDDMEIHFKMNELRRRPQTKPSMPLTFTSPSDWSSVSRILSEGVGMSTLPCTKLQAIVHSAREITRLFHTMQGPRDEMKQELGADDFLPIFIYCVIQADMERPCALCVLLRTLCEPTNRIGEIGYYLASFEAALTHIQEINLSDD